MNQDSTQAVWPADFISLCDFRARCYTNGTRQSSKTGKREPCPGQWAHRFLDHPWVQQAEREGWTHELRSHVIFAVARRIVRNQPYVDIDELMPEKEWVEHRSVAARKHRLAASSQRDIERQFGSMEQYLSRNAPSRRLSAKSLGSAVFQSLNPAGKG